MLSLPFPMLDDNTRRAALDMLQALESRARKLREAKEEWAVAKEQFERELIGS